MEKWLFILCLLDVICYVTCGDFECLLSSYHLCSDGIWCCPDGYVCTGTGKCMSIGSIVGGVIGGVAGLCMLIGCCCYCSKRNRAQNTNQVGVVMQAGGAQSQQYGQPVGGQQYGQSFGGQQYGHPVGGQYNQAFGQPTQKP